jgi:hypothetical protein
MCAVLLKSSLSSFSPHRQTSSDFVSTRRPPTGFEHTEHAVAEEGKVGSWWTALTLTGKTGFVTQKGTPDGKNWDLSNMDYGGTQSEFGGRNCLCSQSRQ